MSDNKKLTIYQRLDRVFSGRKFDTNPTPIVKGNRELLRTTSPEEAEMAKLQAQQDRYLKQQWYKSDGHTLQKALHYEVTRYGSYTDFEQMEHFPEIASALDTYMEEACVSKNGKMLNINSESSRIKQVLTDLFYDRLKIQSTLPMWIRNTAKYGDNFLALHLQSDDGIVDAKQIPNYEIERHEGEFLSVLRGDGNATKTKFFWREQNMTFSEWQIAHFRLLGDDRKLPYGTSILEKCRRVYKQLLLAEDAMLVYRVTRAPERRVYKIYVGNIDDADVPAYVNDIANRFKRAPVIDSQTGNMDMRYNQAANDQDFFIPVRTEDAPNPIDTLPGASNLDAIADIEYLQNKLCVALRVPKTFLGFSESVGEGKNLSLMDIRFSRSVNRLQQAMIQELNKIAIIHLYLLGFTEDLNNFSLSLNNPSSAAEMLDVEQTIIKADAFIKLVSDAGDGFKIMSRTRALKEIFHWSDEEIKQDLLEQRIEKAASSELEATAKIIKHTGLFDKVDRIYGDINLAKKGVTPDGEGGDSDGFGGSSGGGGGFGGGFGGGDSLDDSDFDDADGDLEADLDSDFGDLEDTNDTEDPTTDDTLNEVKKYRKLLIERSKELKTNNIRRSIKNQDKYFNKLMETYRPQPSNVETINNISSLAINKLDDILKDL